MQIECNILDMASHGIFMFKPLNAFLPIFTFYEFWIVYKIKGALITSGIIKNAIYEGN